MALPSGVVPKTVTIGIASFFDGTLADGTVTITAPTNVIHTPTNRPIFSSSMSQRFVDGVATFNLCPTDADGLNNKSWTYKANIIVSGALVQPEPIYFVLPQAGPNEIDLDGLVTVPSSAGVPISATVVTSVNGMIGDVTVAGGGGGAAENVVVHGDVASVARPDIDGPVVWFGTVDPVNSDDTQDVTVYVTEDGDVPTPADVPDASTTVKGIVQLAGDLGGTAAAPTVPGLANKVNTSTYTAGLAAKANTADLAAVAQSGSYNDLANKPTIPAAYTDEQVMDLIGSTIVAGTGITKTVDDAGNTVTLTATGGGGGGLALPAFRAGVYLPTAAGPLNASGMTASRLCAVPFLLEAAQTFDRIALEVTGTIAASTVRLGIYANRSDAYPGALLIDAGTIDGATTGLKTVTISQTLQPGLYWLAAVSSAGVSVRMTGAAMPSHRFIATASPDAYGFSVAETYYQDSVTGALPATFTSTVNTSGTNSGPYVVLRTA